MMRDHPVTPVLTHHARERCEEMGLSTKVAKRIYQRRDLVWPGNPGTDCVMAFSREYPGYGIVVNEADPDRPVIVSVVFESKEEYIRKGDTFEVVAKGA